MCRWAPFAIPGVLGTTLHDDAQKGENMSEATLLRDRPPAGRRFVGSLSALVTTTAWHLPPEIRAWAIDASEVANADSMVNWASIHTGDETSKTGR